MIHGAGPQVVVMGWREGGGEEREREQLPGMRE
jgi:hypothetical protein